MTWHVLGVVATGWLVIAGVAIVFGSLAALASVGAKRLQRALREDEQFVARRRVELDNVVNFQPRVR